MNFFFAHAYWQYPSNSDLPAHANTARIQGYIQTLIDKGVPVDKIAAGLSASGLPGQVGCGEPSDGCGTMERCHESIDRPGYVTNGSTSGAGWTQASLRAFLEFLDSTGVTRVDIWTGDALILVQSVAICDWFVEELRRWRHKPDSDDDASAKLVARNPIRGYRALTRTTP